jgi:hypothetical protein
MEKSMNHRHWMRPVSAVAIAAGFMLALAWGAEPTTQAAFRPFIVSEVPPAPLDPAKLDRIKDGMTLGQIVDDLGPGWISPLSGVGIITWSFTDGRRLSVWPRSYTASEVVTKHESRGQSRMWIEQRPVMPATRPASQPATTQATHPAQAGAGDEDAK